MTGTTPLAVIQTDPAILTQLERIAWSQMVMATITVLVGLAIIGATLYVVKLLRSTVNRIVPQVEPIIAKANGIAATATELSETVQERAEEVLETVHDVNERLRDAADVTEQRVREFAAVLEVVREEAESILLDSAATARGLHVAAERLREPDGGRALRPPARRAPVQDGPAERVPPRNEPEE